MEETERQAWRGPDFRLKRAITLPSGGHRSALVLLTPGTLPQSNGLDPEEIEGLKTSGKSRGAQLGFVPGAEAPFLIASHVRSRGYEGVVGATISAEITIYNHAARPMQLPENAPIGRFYRPGEHITGKELGDTVNGYIHGKSWGLAYKNGKSPREREDSDIEGIWVKIHRKKRRIAPGMDPVKVEDILGAQNYRRAIDKLLTPVTQTSETGLWIGETSIELGTPDGIDAEIDEGVFADIKSPESSKVGRHINALLLDGGKPAWPIRVEVLGKIINNAIDNFIIMRFRRGAKVTS